MVLRLRDQKNNTKTKLTKNIDISHETGCTKRICRVT